MLPWLKPAQCFPVWQKYLFARTSPLLGLLIKKEVQAIGGVNQKIEGFFRTAQGKGLTKEQG